MSSKMHNIVGERVKLLHWVDLINQEPISKYKINIREAKRMIKDDVNTGVNKKPKCIFHRYSVFNAGI